MRGLTDKQLRCLKRLHDGQWHDADWFKPCGTSVLHALVQRRLAEHGWPGNPSGANWRITPEGAEMLRLRER